MYAPSSLITNTNRALPQALKQHPQQLRVLQPPQKQRRLLLIVPQRPRVQLEQRPLQLRLLQLPLAQLEQRPLQLKVLQLPLKRLPLLLKLQRPQLGKLR